MTKVKLRVRDFENDNIPIELRDYLAGDKWIAIRTQGLKAIEEAKGEARCFEACLFLCFPCICCLHHCIYESMVGPRFRE
jgi:hypothetical protein